MRSNSGLITFHFSFFISLSLQLDGGNEDLSPSQHTSSSLVFSLFFSFHLLKIFLFRSFRLIFRLPSDHSICFTFSTFFLLRVSCMCASTHVCLPTTLVAHIRRLSHQQEYKTMSDWSLFYILMLLSVFSIVIKLEPCSVLLVLAFFVHVLLRLKPTLSSVLIRLRSTNCVVTLC